MRKLEREEKKKSDWEKRNNKKKEPRHKSSLQLIAGIFLVSSSGLNHGRNLIVLLSYLRHFYFQFLCAFFLIPFISFFFY